MATTEHTLSPTWTRVTLEAETLHRVTCNSTGAVEIGIGTDSTAPAGSGHPLTATAHMTGEDIGPGAVWARAAPGTVPSDSTLIVTAS